MEAVRVLDEALDMFSGDDRVLAFRQKIMDTMHNTESH